MICTSESNLVQSREPILKVEGLHLLFDLQLHKNQTWRDSFVQNLRNPLKLLDSEPERLPVAENISFEVFEGERVGILGVNGAGKTSLLRTIAGMYSPNKGRVLVQGPVRAIFNSQVGIIKELTGRENARLLVRFMYPEEDDPEAIVEEAISFSELGRFADTPFQFYSNGMQARLSLSLISARPARLLILDEVFEGADAFFKEKVSKRVLNIMHLSGAVLFVSHSRDQILKVCSRVLVLNKGQIAFDGLPKDALSFYKERGAHA